ncbi:hypothetical protein PybrP1_001396 [[Pythium] brassicae (nom. inval.)]|nr:hypothetical protein PybrP1_001396 [[Pythium] brassicae (nom. inval.)]
MQGAVGSAMWAAARCGKVGIVKYLSEFGPEMRELKRYYVTADAAGGDHLEIVTFFHECGNPDIFDTRAMNRVAVNGHFDVVRFLQENRDEGCWRSTLEFEHKNEFSVRESPNEERGAKYLTKGTESNVISAVIETIERGRRVADAAGRRLYRYERERFE